MLMERRKGRERRRAERWERMVSGLMRDIELLAESFYCERIGREDSVGSNE